MRLFLIEFHRYYFIIEHSSSVQAYLRASNIFLILEYVRANLDDSVCPLQRTGNIGKTMAREKSSVKPSTDSCAKLSWCIFARWSQYEKLRYFFALLALRALLSNNRRGESDFGELSGANFIIPEYGYIIWKARVLYPKQSTSMHTRDATSCARICRLIALVIRARLGKARHKWKFRGIAVHTRCFIPR